ncbi:MAG: PilZ domain-containing protein [Deltaproteobacteria bacterium]|nr:PilZ domain-containing protein [Deltaproteobacteria bacterium]MBW2613154.1 PilZ domain-containing protein [Deltaproteobacteria bacterium]MBW2677523.1 PilZ domain-containing protein [Deltaproteobacteria bacterium]
MIKTIYISATNHATITCPQCETTKTVDVSRYAGMEQTVRVKSRCACGHTWTSVLEKRKQYRKGVSLPGTFTHIVDGNPLHKGTMAVTDLSAGGLKIKLGEPFDLRSNDKLHVEFHLNDARHTLISKNVLVKNVDGLYIGVAFSRSEPDDPALGFYLMG